MIIKYSEDDLKKLNFQYVVQMDNHHHHECIFECKNPGFWIEKRMKVIIANGEAFGMFGYFYGGSEQLTKEKLLARLNGNAERYYRVLNKKEVDWFTEWLRDRSA